MTLLHLLALACLGTIAGAHTLHCLEDAAVTTHHWVGAAAYCLLTVVQVAMFVLHLRDRKRGRREEPPLVA